MSVRVSLCIYCLSVCEFVQLVERHVMLMACELIVFIVLLTYTSTRHQSTASSTKTSSSVSSPAAGTSVTPRSVTRTTGGSSRRRSGDVEELQALSLTSSQHCHRAVVNSIDMLSPPTTSPQRRRSVDHTRTCLWSDVPHTAAIKSGQCFMFPCTVSLNSTSASACQLFG